MIRPDCFISFAYGSNMSTARIQERCRSATPLGVAELSGHDLRWHKRGRTDGSGKCDIVVSERPEARVFGVLYRIADCEKRTLDRAEGLGQGYAEITVQVLCEGTPTTARAYQATDIDPRLQPFSWYHALVVAGAREHGLPPAYIERLKAIAVQEDPDRGRHETHMRLIERAQA